MQGFDPTQQPAALRRTTHHNRPARPPRPYANGGPVRGSGSQSSSFSESESESKSTSHNYSY